MQLPDDVDVLVWALDTDAPAPRMDLVVAPYMSPPKLLTRLRTTSVRLVQSQSIGVDGVEEFLPPGIMFANASTVHEASTAELALALILASQRSLAEFIDDQRAERWRWRFTDSLTDRGVLLLGYGGVGRAIAHRLRAFDARVTPVARHPRVVDGVPVQPLGALPALLPEAEIVVLALPASPGTRHVVDDGFMRALPKRSLIVNVGRGSLVDTGALVHHLHRGQVRAALDVTEPEPLPVGHPLWHSPNVLLTPHVGGASSAMGPRMVRLIVDQVLGMRSGRSPLNLVTIGETLTS